MIDKYGYSRGYNIWFLEDLPKKNHFSDLIVNICHMTNCKNYLEIGLYNGDTIMFIKDVVDNVSGVDVEQFSSDLTGIDFYKMTSDEFFMKNDKNFDIIFIDGDHSFGQVKKDFENSLKVLNKFGIIILHDTDPIHEKLLASNFCHDSNKIIDYIYVDHPELNVISLPILETGLALVMRRSDRRIKNLLK